MKDSSSTGRIFPWFLNWFPSDPVQESRWPIDSCLMIYLSENKTPIAFISVEIIAICRNSAANDELCAIIAVDSHLFECQTSCWCQQVVQLVAHFGKANSTVEQSYWKMAAEYEQIMKRWHR